jgi:hypothetical protein
MACDVNTLLSSGKDFQKLSKRELQICICQLLCNVSSGGSGSVLAGSYGGAAPSITPSGPAVNRDPVTGDVWWFDGTSWSQ